ncbi:sulfotransferase family 2 domain-containing protein [Thalassotalea sp. SU-HH00458]|uniref:sulfotransferase family 2 domain-containing protein n=1 Tax=Thalassotalea sp. SU-HH00458 TaxID=3127657 RepID=UPI0031042EE1
MKKTLSTMINYLTQRLGYEFSIHRINPKNTSQKPVVFVHIPKCGGVSVDRALREQLALPGERKIKRTPLIDTSLFNFEKEIVTLADKCDFSEFHAKQIQDILVYHLNLNWQYVSGHFNVTGKILEEFSDSYQFVTLLRDPVDRLISNYIFNKLTNTFAIMPPSIATKPMTKDELWLEADQILNSRRGWHMANTMTMFLTGRYPKDEADAKNMQNEVLDNLSKFSVVGTLDDMPSFEQRLNRVSGKSFQIGKHNTTREIQSIDSKFIQDSLIEYFNQEKVKRKLETLCSLDVTNYQKQKHNNI